MPFDGQAATPGVFFGPSQCLGVHGHHSGNRNPIRLFAHRGDGLEAGGKVWGIAKLGPDHFVPLDRVEIPAGRGEIIMTVDGQERRWNVRIPNDVLPFDNAVKIQHA